MYIILSLSLLSHITFATSEDFLTWDNLVMVDQSLLIVCAAIYGLLYFIPTIFSVYFVYTRPDSVRDEREFDKTWYKWKKQWIWHELSFRSHVLYIIALTVIFLFEGEWPIWTPPIVVGSIGILCIGSKCVANCIKPRIPSDDQAKYFYKLDMRHSVMNHRQNIDAMNQTLGTKPTAFGQNNRTYHQGLNRWISNSFIATKKDEDKYVPLLTDQGGAQSTDQSLIRDQYEPPAVELGSINQTGMYHE